VHALGNIAVFDTQTRIPAPKIAYALNARLPQDIRIVRSEEVPGDWHPRRVRARKTYAYRILCAPFPDPMRRLYTLHFPGVLVYEAMQEALQALVGEHDFASFCKMVPTLDPPQSTIRTIYWTQLEQQNDELIMKICGNGFLYNMVRIIAGTVLDIGCGRRKEESIHTILGARNRASAGPTAPAHALTLIGYDFD
jgi:tRNA pseudouridine38-40 synthase